MKKNVSTTSFKDRIKRKLRCKWWWIDQLNDLVGIAGLFLIVSKLLPLWVGLSLLITSLIMAIVYKHLIDNEVNA